MMRWEPFPELMSLRQAMEKLFEDPMVRPSRVTSTFGHGVFPSIDVYQDPKEVVIKAAVPGVRQEDVDVHVTDNGVTIRGERHQEKEIKREDYYYQEQFFGGFSRYISLPDGLATDKADASLEDGVLTITIPKAEEAKPRTIKVRQAQNVEAKKEAKTIKAEPKQEAK